MAPLGAAEFGKFHHAVFRACADIFGDEVYLLDWYVKDIRSGVLYLHVVAADSVVIAYVFQPHIPPDTVSYVNDVIADFEIGV